MRGPNIGKLNPPKIGRSTSPVGKGLSSPRRSKKLGSPIGSYKIGRKTQSKKMREVFG